MKIKNKKGFIQIPILIIIIIGIIIIGATGYSGIEQYQDHQRKKSREELSPKENKTINIDGSSEIRKLRQEVDDLKKQTARQKLPTVAKLKSQNPQQFGNLINENKMQLLEANKILSNKIIIARVKPSVVYIETPSGSGSGIIVSTDGYVLTNAHVVTGKNSATIKLIDSQSFNGVVVGRDENIDLALLKINVTDLLPAVLGNSDSVEQGDPVFTFGYPFGLEGDVSFKEGTISRRFSDGSSAYLETSAEIHPGNSGGPLINQSGEVIGVNTLIRGVGISGIIIGEAIKLAIPINIAKELLPALKAGKIVVIPSTSISIVPSKQYSETQEKAYYSFNSDLNKIITDTNAGIDALEKSRQSYALDDYSTALDYAQKELVFFTSAYYSISALDNNLSQEIPWRDIAKKITGLKVSEVVYLRAAAEQRKTRISARISGNIDQAYGASVEENQSLQKAKTPHDELNAKILEIRSKAKEYF